MSWEDILKLRPIEDIPDEMYDDSYSYENPKEIESLMRRKQGGQGLMAFIKRDWLNPPNEAYKLWDKVVSDIKNEYDNNDFTHKNYRNGNILAGRYGVDNSVLGLITNLGTGNTEWKDFLLKHGINV